MLKVNINYVETKSGIPVLEFTSKHGKKVYHAAIDTGSELSIFDSKLEKMIQHSGEKQTCTVHGMVVSNEQEFLEGYLPMVMTGIENETIIIPIKGFSTQLGELKLEKANGEIIIVNAIVGSDTLRCYDAKIDYEKKLLRLKL